MLDENPLSAMRRKLDSPPRTSNRYSVQDPGFAFQKMNRDSRTNLEQVLLSGTEKGDLKLRSDSGQGRVEAGHNIRFEDNSQYSSVLFRTAADFMANGYDRGESPVDHSENFGLGEKGGSSIATSRDHLGSTTGGKVSSSFTTDDPMVVPSYGRIVTNVQQAPSRKVAGLAGKRGPITKRAELSIAKGRFIMKTSIGAGSFGEIFWGIDTITNKEVAIKLESIKVRHSQLQYESRIYKILHMKDDRFHPSITRFNKNIYTANNKVVPTRGGALADTGRSGSHIDSDRKATASAATFQELREVVGFPQCYYYGTEGEYNVMVMDLLGPNLEELFNYCHRKFSLKTVCLLADQMLHRIEYVHHKGFIHRDLKPENFTLGGDPSLAHVVHLIDFGLSKRFRDPRTNMHVTYKEGKSLTGTARYCSINAHLGIEQSRRDDIESLGYILLYFLKHGFLPWQGIRGVPDPQTKNARISEKKINTRLEVLCRDEPPQILKFMTYARGLKFEETPDYTSCREFFASIMDRQNLERDWVFDWMVRRHAERQRLETVQPTRTPLNTNVDMGLLRSENTPNTFIRLEPRTSSNQIQDSEHQSSSELSIVLSVLDDKDLTPLEPSHNYNFSNPINFLAPQLAPMRQVEPIRSNKVHMQPVDLPGDIEYML